MIGASRANSEAGCGIPPRTSGELRTASDVFDFSTFFTLKDNKGNYKAWYGFGYGLGLVGDTTDNLPWKNRAVTFLENHDTGYRTNEDGTPEQDHGSDSFTNNWEVEQATPIFSPIQGSLASTGSTILTGALICKIRLRP